MISIQKANRTLMVNWREYIIDRLIDYKKILNFTIVLLDNNYDFVNLSQILCNNIF